MRKLFTGFLTICLLLTAALPVTCAAEEEAETAEPEEETEAAAEVLDLSGYDDDTLVALLQQVQAEMVTRRIERTATLQAGTYVFGQDIPVGKYVLKKSPEGPSGILEYYAAKDPEGDSQIYEFISSDEVYEAYIAAEEGDVLKTEFPCELMISAGVKFE